MLCVYVSVCLSGWVGRIYCPALIIIGIHKSQKAISCTHTLSENSGIVVSLINF